MPSLNWESLNKLQLGRYAEYYAKMEFASYGFEVYTCEVDDHGVDFIAKRDEEYFDVQVKSIRKGNYVYLNNKKLKIADRFLICYLVFKENALPDIYIFPSTVWRKAQKRGGRELAKVFKTYAKEYGIYYCKNADRILEPYRAESFFEQFKTDGTTG